MPLGRRAEPFSDPDWLFELKYDGFRAFAHVSDGGQSPRVVVAIDDALTWAKRLMDAIDRKFPANN